VNGSMRNTTTAKEEVEGAEDRPAHTDHRQWAEDRRGIAQGHRVEDSEGDEEAGEDAVDMDIGLDLSRGRGAGRRAGVPRDLTADLCRGPHRRGEEDIGVTHRRGEVDVVEVEGVQAAVAAVEAEEARATARMAVEVHATAAGVEIVDRRRMLPTNA
jgi:hypothetical protein